MGHWFMDSREAKYVNSVMEIHGGKQGSPYFGLTNMEFHGGK